MSSVSALYARWRDLIHELAKFGVVGLVAYIVDVGIYNAAHVGAGIGPNTAKTLSTVVAATVAYFGNRHWSFRSRARTGVRREYAIFIVLSAIGLAIALGFLDFGFYVLDQRSTLASNIWGNVIGTGVATVFRYWAYKRYVFLHPDHPKVVAAEEAAAAAAAAADPRGAGGARVPEAAA